MSNPGEHPVQADAATLATLRELTHQLGTNKVTEYAVSIGIRPPDDRPHCWYIVEEYDPDQTYQGLFWDGPDE
jgi:hypothetical protein